MCKIGSGSERDQNKKKDRDDEFYAAGDHCAAPFRVLKYLTDMMSEKLQRITADIIASPVVISQFFIPRSND